MKLNAVGIPARDILESVKFYELIGFKFGPCDKTSQHVEATSEGSAKLMLDSFGLIKDMLGYEPTPANTSAFCVEFDSPSELDAVAEKLKAAGYTFEKEPWDAFWGQRYAVVRDPSGYLVDLYATLK